MAKAVQRTLENKVAAVTGAASGIGRALALELATRRCHLALADIDETGLADTKKRAQELGVRVTADAVDVRSREAVERWAESSGREHGRVELVVNNAGVGLVASVEETSYEDFQWLLATNFWGVVHGTKAFLPLLKRAEWAHIVNVSSVYGLVGAPGQAAYNASKFAVRGFSEALGMELDLEGGRIGLTCVHPGFVKTNILHRARLRGASSERRSELLSAFTARAQLGPEQVAERIVLAVLRNERRVVIGHDALALDCLQRLLPSTYRRPFSRFFR